MDHKLLVLSGPSGAGIGDIVNALFAQRHDLSTVTPVTARKMKAGEQDGVGFYFYDLEAWNAMKDSGELLECTEFAGNDYGTSRRLVREQLASGRHALLTLSVERAARLKANMPEALCVYAEPSPDVLRRRYEALSRSALELRVRLEEAERMRALSGFCDLHLCSDSIPDAAEALCALLDR